MAANILFKRSVSRSHRWKGQRLADATIKFCEEWREKGSSFELCIENIPGVDLLIDTINAKCESQSVEALPIVALTRNVRKGAKNSRICRLQTLWDCVPPAIRIKYGPHIGPLFEEVEAFVPSDQNRGRQINTLDALAIAAFGS